MKIDYYFSFKMSNFIRRTTSANSWNARYREMSEEDYFDQMRPLNDLLTDGIDEWNYKHLKPGCHHSFENVLNPELVESIPSRMRTEMTNVRARQCSKCNHVSSVVVNGLRCDAVMFKSDPNNWRGVVVGNPRYQYRNITFDCEDLHHPFVSSYIHNYKAEVVNGKLLVSFGVIIQCQACDRPLTSPVVEFETSRVDLYDEFKNDLKHELEAVEIKNVVYQRFQTQEDIEQMWIDKVLKFAHGLGVNDILF